MRVLLQVENLLLSSEGYIRLCDFGSATTSSYYPDHSWTAIQRSTVEDEVRFFPLNMCCLCFSSWMVHFSAAWGEAVLGSYAQHIFYCDSGLVCEFGNFPLFLFHCHHFSSFVCLCVCLFKIVNLIVIFFWDCYTILMCGCIFGLSWFLDCAKLGEM